MLLWSKLLHKGVSSLSLEVCKQRQYVHNGQIRTGTIQPFGLWGAFTNTSPLILTATSASERHVPPMCLPPHDTLKEGGALDKLFRVVRIQ